MHSLHVGLDVPLAIAAVVAVRAENVEGLAGVLLQELVTVQFHVALATVKVTVLAAYEKSRHGSVNQFLRPIV